MQWLRGFLKGLLAATPQGEVQTLRRRLLKFFIISRLVSTVAGVWFDASGLNAMHLVDLNLLQHDFWRSMLYQHIQPPLFNVLTALTLWVTPNGYEAFFLWPLFVLLGWLLMLGLYRLMVALGVLPRLAFWVSFLFGVSPAVLYFGSWYGYAFPITVAMVWSAVYLTRWFQTHRPRHLALFFTLLLVPVGMHTLFLWPWMLLPFVAVLVAARRHWRQVLLCGALPVLVCLSFPAKNYWLYGSFSASSWVGLTLDYMVNVFNANVPLTEKLYDEKKVSILALYRNPQVPVAQLPAPLNQLPPTGIPVLDTPTKPDGSINYNHMAYLLEGRILQHDALEIFKAEPVQYWKTLQNALFIYLLPTSDYLWTRSKSITCYWDWLWNAITAGRLGWSSRPVFVQLAANNGGYEQAFAPSFAGTLARTPWYLVGWLNFILVPGLVGYAAWQSWRGLTHSKLPAARRAGLVWLGYNVAYVTFMAVFLAISENQRYRLYISPFLAVYVALIAQALAVRYLPKPPVKGKRAP